MRIIITLSTLFALAACSSAPPSLQYYLLDSPAKVSAPHTQTKRQIRLELLPLPEYLQQDGLVMRLSDSSLHVSRQHLWAQALQQSVPQVLVDALNNHQEVRFVTQNEPGALQAGERLVIQIRHLLIDQQQGAILSAQYWLLDQQGSIHFQGSFNQSQQMAHDGYPHAVENLQLLLKNLAAQIQTEL
ncbi:membrane integrity-associated transporter subunit PqiC [Bowmanella sp. Y26]|uniref:PqiC family protein n=1 Tax=Bowmanella yangjiangensis TaxID=2811230 RepID=UPI001BDC1C69|nr:ABC-type transport auxiliary lipoprotein family protein [Bowmanella yangjiangensis]MBT1062831.1 membrane integrity-associated transporter subunit PqiC [Bowmanella yangjiangensis]